MLRTARIGTAGPEPFDAPDVAQAVNTMSKTITFDLPSTDDLDAMARAGQTGPLTDVRAQAYRACRDLLDGAELSGRDLLASERRDYDRLMRALDRIDLALGEAQRAVEDRDRARAPYEHIVRPPFGPVGVGGSGGGEIRRMLAEGRGLDLPYPSVESRDLTYYTGSSGANLLPTSMARQIYAKLEPMSGVLAAGPRLLDTATGEPLVLPTCSSHGTAALLGAGSAIAEADPAWGQVSLSSYKFGQLAQAPQELIADAGVDLDGFLASDFGHAMGRAVGQKLTLGTGTNEPGGITTAGFGTAAVMGTGVAGAPSYANLNTAVFALGPAYRTNARWIVSDTFLASVMGMTDTTNRPIFLPPGQVGSPPTLLGYPVFTDPWLPAMATASISCYFGDWESAFVVRRVGQMRVERSVEYAWDRDVVSFRCLSRWDAATLDQTAATSLIGGTA
ncbi:MAG: phage major capsid protein [Acidimicrobiales bacterium]|nr:phage major capsid protein [Acidimicrobiales bacterium]